MQQRARNGEQVLIVSIHDKELERMKTIQTSHVGCCLSPTLQVRFHLWIAIVSLERRFEASPTEVWDGLPHKSYGNCLPIQGPEQPIQRGRRASRLDPQQVQLQQSTTPPVSTLASQKAPGQKETKKRPVSQAPQLREVISRCKFQWV